MARRRKSEAWKEISLVTSIRQRSKKSLNIVLWKSSRLFLHVVNSQRSEKNLKWEIQNVIFPGWGSVSGPRGATVQTVRDVAPVKPGPLSCGERITRGREHTLARSMYVCPRGNNKGVKFRNEKSCRPPLLESQPSSARTKRRLFRLSHL